MIFKSILIVTYGRSGSTLLQGLLNTIDGCVVRGENLNLCYGLFKAYESLQKAFDEHGKKEKTDLPTSPWFGAELLDENRFLEDARALVAHQLSGQNRSDNGLLCYGFKEIRYLPTGFPGGKRELKKYLEFLCRLFPEPAIVVLTRSHEQVANSAWWKEKSTDVVVESLSAFEGALGEFAVGRDNVFFITYADMVARSERVNALFEFLGAPFEELRVNEVLATRHSYSLEPNQTASQRNVCYQAELVESETVSYCLIDNIHPTVDSSRIRVAGVVLPAGAKPGDLNLFLIISGKEQAVEWGLPSPKVGARFNDIAFAGCARFKVDVDPWHDGAAQLIMRDLQGNSTTVATITVCA